jgi:predicted Kef-type K+ transport protein
VDNSANLSVLLSTLRALPYLIKVGLSFYKAIESDDALLLSLTLDIVVVEESYKYYIRVIYNAI